MPCDRCNNCECRTAHPRHEQIEQVVEFVNSKCELPIIRPRMTACRGAIDNLIFYGEFDVDTIIKVYDYRYGQLAHTKWAFTLMPNVFFIKENFEKHYQQTCLKVKNRELPAKVMESAVNLNSMRPLPDRKEIE